MTVSTAEPLICPGHPFGGLAVPHGVEILRIRSQAGWISCMRAHGTGEHHGVALFVPGLTGSKEDFYPIFPLLARSGWGVWAISQRGQADSSAPQGRQEYTREKTAQDVLDVAAIICHATGTKKIHLVGHSFGGTVAQAAVIRDSSPFRSLVLMDSGPCGWPGRHDDMIERLRSHPDDDLWSLDNPRLAQAPDEQLSLQQRFLRDRSKATSRDQLLGALDQLADVHDTSFEVLGTGLPVAVIYGENDCGSWPQEWLRREGRITGARIVVIPNAGHCPQQDNPSETCRQLVGFWSALG